MLTCKVGDKTINCYDGIYSKEQLKKWAEKNILLCPICGKHYEYCHGEVKIPYFRHKDKEKCLDKYSEPETDEHLNGKIQLYEWIKKQNGVTDAVLEGWIPETKQRPDIMFKYNGEQYVIEYQCTPISSEYYERHNLYKLVGIKDIWICGSDRYFQYYHKESGKTGIKGINELEKRTHLYYNSKEKMFFIIDKKMNDKKFENIINNKNKDINLMITPFDYQENKENFHIIKDEYKSYKTRFRYPSPTGRPSRKYPYPYKEYIFNENVSLAKVIKIEDYVFEG